MREYPASKNKVLFVNPHFTLNIKGMGELESQNLFQFLYHQAEIPEYQYRHIWQPQTIVMWDNRSTQHYAPRDYTECRQLLNNSETAHTSCMSASVSSKTSLSDAVFSRLCTLCFPIHLDDISIKVFDQNRIGTLKKKFCTDDIDIKYFHRVLV